MEKQEKKPASKLAFVVVAAISFGIIYFGYTYVSGIDKKPVADTVKVEAAIDSAKADTTKAITVTDTTKKK